MQMLGPKPLRGHRDPSACKSGQAAKARRRDKGSVSEEHVFLEAGPGLPLLVRVPGADLHMYGTVWLLTQGESRKTKRVRLFTEFVSRRLAAYAPLLAGLSVSGN